MLQSVSLFGEETAEQIFNLLREIEDLPNAFGEFPKVAKIEEKRLIKAVFDVREMVLISAVNAINRFFEETETAEFTNDTWQELKSLYLYGKGYHKALQDEKDALQRAYRLFAYQLSKQGKLAENLDLTRNAYF